MAGGRRGPLGYVPARRGVSPTQRRIAAQQQQYRAREDVRAFQQRLEQARTERARQRGFPSRAAYERAVRAGQERYGLTREVSRELGRQRYWEAVRNFRDTNFPAMTLQEARRTAGFRDVLVGLQSTDTSPDGPLARALVALGRRDPFARYQVGETP